MKEIQKAFKEFTNSYYMQNEEYDINIKLKFDHSQRVAILGENIARSESGFDSNTAYIASLLHDVGRFEQYRIYKSFNDSVSDNHGELGYRTLLSEHRLLDLIPESMQELVLACVRYHNAFEVPEELSDETKRYLHLVRDADKIDIIGLFINLIVEDELTECLVHKLPITDRYTDAVAEKLINGEMIRSGELQTATDLKLMLLSWFNDFEYQKGIEILKEMKLPERLRSTLPNDNVIDEVYKSVVGRIT